MEALKAAGYRKIDWLTKVALIVLLAVLGIGWSGPVMAQQKPFKIGHVGGFTGPWAILNVHTQIGLKLAIDEINKAGGLLGRKVEYYPRDGKGRPDVSLSEARDLILDQGVDVLIGPFNGGAALAVSSIAKEFKTPCFEVTGTFVTGKEGHRYLFHLAISSDQIGFSLGEYLSEMPWKKYYTIGTNYVFAHEVIGYAWKRLSENKPNVEKVGELWPKIGERDYTTFITAIGSAKPEAVISLLPGSMGIDFRRQAKGFGLFKKTQFIAVPMSTSDIVPLGRETPAGIIGLADYFFPYCGQTYPLAAKLEEKYDKIAKDHDYTCVANGYNQLLFLREAVKKAGSTDKEKIIDAAEGLEVDSTVGRIKCLPYSHRGTVPVFIGTTTYSPKYPFAIFENVKTYRGEKFMLREEEIHKMRGK